MAVCGCQWEPAKSTVAKGTWRRKQLTKYQAATNSSMEALDCITPPPPVLLVSSHERRQISPFYAKYKYLTLCHCGNVFVSGILNMVSSCGTITRADIIVSSLRIFMTGTGVRLSLLYKRSETRWHSSDEFEAKANHKQRDIYLCRSRSSSPGSRWLVHQTVNTFPIGYHWSNKWPNGCLFVFSSCVYTSTLVH